MLSITLHHWIFGVLPKGLLMQAMKSSPWRQTVPPPGL
ncbi:hypothetical protein L838_4381 [Mycobacterium avium MAV_120709_2344]|nr:hypothetical protein L838_4381 [Mycobacterium avium MAV_120709_2344]